jgi:hypothetical protein
METMTDWVEAEIQGVGEGVRYRRAGTGPAVLLLGLEPSTHHPWFERLARTRRVHALLSLPPRQRQEAARWLEGVVEGLGLSAPDLYAAAELAPLLSWMVARNGGALGRVIFLPPVGQGAAAHGADPSHGHP